MNYYQSLTKLHAAIRPRTYLEIGIRDGESLQLARGNALCIGIDPAYALKFPYNKNTILIKDTSDAFFDSDQSREIFSTNKIDFAFIDGMHKFEYTLRDFINTEQNASQKGVIAIHDCIPRDEETAARERKTDYWTGDVWKIINILKQYRPDLKIHILDSAPSGLALISNLDPSSDVLSANLEAILEEYLDYDFAKSKHAAVDSDSFDYIMFSSQASVGEKLSTLARKVLRKPKALGVLLCYNDADILEDAILHLLSNHHELIVWDHGSSDETSSVLDKFKDRLLEYKYVPREFDFYKLYPTMSQHLINYYIDEFDWISWPDQDEILEGPDRTKTYYEFITDVFRSKYNWIQFNNFNYWFTEKDKPEILSPVERIKHYALFPNCAPRIRSWRASVTNIREFNHNPLEGERYPQLFNLRHYSMRSEQQMRRRLEKDRADIQKGNKNVHYNNMKKRYESLMIKSNQLLLDDGGELNPTVKFDWNKIYF